MSLSSFCVVSNALRLNLFKMNKKDCPVKPDNDIKAMPDNDIMTKAILEEKKMEERTIKVNGMMCEHCEMHVKKALEAIDGIDAASADHKKGEVKLTLSKAVADDAMKAAVTDAGYEFIG
jgi:Cu2+-exporting ATPase